MAAILKKFKEKKLCIDLKWREMRSKMIFGHPKGTSKMAAGGHFEKIIQKKKLRIDLKW